MSGDRRDLEHELTQHLSETADAPRPDAAARVRVRVAATLQRGAWRVRAGEVLRSPGWARAGAMAAVAGAVLLIGIYIGQVGLPIQLGPSASPSAAASDGSPTARPSGRPGPSAAASVPPATAMSFAVWQRLDMPDPAPGVFGGGTPSSVVAFNGGYLAVGTIRTECCAEADPAANAGVVWTSTDGRDWQLVEAGDTFEHASLSQVVTDGERLIAAGSYAEPVDDAPSMPVGATWTSSDGVTWQRSSGAAPSRVAVMPSGLVGVHAGDDGMTSFSSSDGATWTRRGTLPDVEEVSTLVARPDGAMVIEIQPGAPLADGSPTQDSLVWVTTDGANWTGGSSVENARLTSVAPFAGEFVAVGSRTEVLAEGGEVAAITSVWTSPDGMTWQERETDIGHPSENALGVFAVGQALVMTVECCGGDLPLVPLARVSEDGASWTPVPPQPAFEGVDVRVVSVVGSQDGLLAVGSRWDPELNHPVPQAWLASSEPMVWLGATSESGAEVGTEYDFTFGHCGLQSPIDFDGSLWVLAGSDYDSPPVPLDMLEGTIRLTGTDSAIFEDSASNWALALSRHDGANAYPLCD